jgi:hypothetical protein
MKENPKLFEHRYSLQYLDTHSKSKLKESQNFDNVFGVAEHDTNTGVSLPLGDIFTTNNGILLVDLSSMLTTNWQSFQQ